MFNIKKNKKGKGRGVVIQTVVAPKVYEQIEEVSKNNGLTISGLLRLMIMQHLNPTKDESDIQST